MAKLEESMHPIALFLRYGESEDRRAPPSKRNPDVVERVDPSPGVMGVGALLSRAAANGRFRE